VATPVCSQCTADATCAIPQVPVAPEYAAPATAAALPSTMPSDGWRLWPTTSAAAPSGCAAAAHARCDPGPGRALRPPMPARQRPRPADDGAGRRHAWRLQALAQREVGPADWREWLVLARHWCRVEFVDTGDHRCGCRRRTAGRAAANCVAVQSSARTVADAASAVCRCATGLCPSSQPVSMPCTPLMGLRRTTPGLRLMQHLHRRLQEDNVPGAGRGRLCVRFQLCVLGSGLRPPPLPPVRACSGIA
jgi:hypothetical protein